jgi:hypothetical protein
MKGDIVRLTRILKVHARLIRSSYTFSLNFSQLRGSKAYPRRDDYVNRLDIHGGCEIAKKYD